MADLRWTKYPELACNLVLVNTCYLIAMHGPNVTCFFFFFFFEKQIDRKRDRHSVVAAEKCG